MELQPRTPVEFTRLLLSDTIHAESDSRVFICRLGCALYDFIEKDGQPIIAQQRQPWNATWVWQYWYGYGSMMPRRLEEIWNAVFQALLNESLETPVK